MAIISKVEAKSLKGRLTHAAMFLVLTLGGLTMVYPFLVMVSGSLRSEMDETDLDVVPAFLVDDDTLQRKFRETKYNQLVPLMNMQLLEQNFAFRSAGPGRDIHPAEVRVFREWIASAGMPVYWKALGGTAGVKRTPPLLRELRDRLSEKFGGDVVKFGEATGAPISSWSQVVFPAPEWVSQRSALANPAVFDVYLDMMREAPPAMLLLSPVTGFFLETMVYPSYGQMDTGKFNQAHGTALRSFSEFRLPPTVPRADERPLLRQEWIEFVTGELHPSFLVAAGQTDTDWRAFLMKTYGDIASFNREHGTSHADFEVLRLPRREWLEGLARDDYRAFRDTLPPESWRIDAPEFAYRDHLLERFGSLGAINTALGTRYESLAQIACPMDQLEAEYVLENSLALRWEFATLNFRNVFDELFQRGRAFANTVVLCLLAVAAALLVNPMAAYAMSRMKLPGTYKILMVLMATMAFPPMVSTIPTFMILREANLLNTFYALLLPGIANGFLIFMLKGFFDSLPQELYEAAVIDGASEVRIFFQITMALSKPILAVVALGAFNSAYGMFLYALIVCPSPDMWVLNVWLYQWQQNASSSAIFASVLVASLPTLLVFLLAQNVIMRGIVVPTEK